MTKTATTGPVPRKPGTKKRRVWPAYKPIVLVPRGELSRPPGSHISIEIFDEHLADHYPPVRITADAHGKIRALIAACRLEVSWLSPTKVAPDGGVVIYDALVPHQRCTGGSTVKLETRDLDGEDRLLCELMNERKFDMIRDLICWGHSHVNGMTFPSSVDENQTRDYLRRMQEMGKTRFVRLIANKGDDLFASLYLLDEGRAIHHAPIHAEPPNTKRWEAWAEQEIATKVVEVVPKQVATDYGDLYGQFDNEALIEALAQMRVNRLAVAQQSTTGVPTPWPWPHELE